MGARQHDLGHGVSVDESVGRGPVVISFEVALPWRPRAAQFVGTAVAWDGQLFEIIGVERRDGVERWQLAPWPEEEVSRNIDTLDSQRIEFLAGENVANKHSRIFRWVLILTSPLAGMMPGPVQEDWERNHNFPAARATVLSAIVELLFGTWWIINPGPIVVRIFGLMLFSEAMVRLWSGLSQDAPMGSFLALPFARLMGRPPTDPTADVERVEVVRWSRDDGALELALPEPRVAWVIDEILRFRGSLYRLVEVKFGGDGVAYSFDEVSEDTAPTISLVPPKKEKPQRDRGRGFFVDTGRFLLLAFAPGRYQESLAPDLNLGVRTLTWISAGCELFGGAVNLTGPAAGDALIGVDLFFVVEGAWRLGTTVFTGSPVGSVFGLPFLGVYQRWVDSAERD